MPETSLHVELLAFTPLPQQVSAFAARLCYSADSLAALRKKTAASDQEEFLGQVVESGHLSVLEHVSFTFMVEGVSRVLLAQLTRHRIASFSVQSQRYVSLKDGFSYIVPPAIRALGPDAAAEYAGQMQQIHAWYKDWQSRLQPGEAGNEDARFVLPGACETRLVMTMNARELLHFFSLRCCRRAQWEIRALAEAMLRLCKAEAPALFGRAGPSCVRGPCPEGKRSCGKAAQVRVEYLARGRNEKNDGKE